MSDKPLECLDCKKPAKVFYKEIDQQIVTCTHMCENCPILKKKIYGEDLDKGILTWSNNKLCCVNCGTSTESLNISTTLGCSECYHIFEKLVIEKMTSEGLIPQKMISSYKKNNSIGFHVGLTPHKKESKMLSNTMIDLSEALKEALKKENYETAAQLRDQINQLMDNPNDKPASP